MYTIFQVSSYSSYNIVKNNCRCSDTSNPASVTVVAQKRTVCLYKYQGQSDITQSLIMN